MKIRLLETLIPGEYNKGDIIEVDVTPFGDAIIEPGVLWENREDLGKEWELVEE